MSRLLSKALKNREKILQLQDPVAIWKALFLTPDDYTAASIFDPATRDIMEKVEFEHGGPSYD